MIFCVPSGTRICQLMVVRESRSKVAMPLMAGCGTLRLRSQRVEEPCGSRSMSSVLSPRAAKYAARLIASVVLPEPPLGFRTTMRCMCFLTRLNVFVRMWFACEALERLATRSSGRNQTSGSTVTPDTAMRHGCSYDPPKLVCDRCIAMERFLLLWDEIDDLVGTSRYMVKNTRDGLLELGPQALTGRRGPDPGLEFPDLKFRGAPAVCRRHDNPQSNSNARKP